MSAPNFINLVILNFSSIIPAMKMHLYFLSMLVAFLCAGCRQTPATHATNSPGETFSLVSVDGKAVPCTVQHGGHPVTVKSGEIILGETSCTSKTVFTAPNGNDIKREVQATCKKDGSAITMKWKGAGTTTGKLDGSTFTMNNEGMIFAYSK